jgi:hypothetical protein
MNQQNKYVITKINMELANTKSTKYIWENQNKYGITKRNMELPNKYGISKILKC